MAKNGNASKQKEKLIEEYNTELEHLNQILGDFQKTIDALQKGDGDKPYWNGENACSVVKNSLTQLYSDYDLLNHLCQCKTSIKK